MIRFIKKKNIVIFIILITIIISIFVQVSFTEKVDRNRLIKNLEVINSECNLVYENKDDSEKKYLKFLDNEKDSFKRGMYSSALVQFYVINNDYDNAIKYSKEAVENYNKVNGGEYYSIAEKKYAAWFMLKLGRYSDSFKETSELLELLKGSSNEVFTEDEVRDTEALIYSIFLCIYSEFEIIDKAEIYYNKLCNIDMNEKLEISKGDKISASKMMYAEKISDADLMKKYADECYEISLKRDEANGTSFSDGMISNVALANIRLGNYEVAFDQLQRAEEFQEKVGSSLGLVNIYSNYAEYYSLLGNVELAIEYYNKTIDLYKGYEDYYSLKHTIEKLVKFLVKNNITDNINFYYKEYYDISMKIGGDRAINELLSQIVDINDELNKSSLLILEKESKDNEIAVTISIIVIGILIFMVTRMYSLIKSKNKSEKKLEKIANIDYLTGVNTRAYGEKLILKEINKSNDFSMAIIDIDNFKKINDSYGHIFGDLILKEIAEKLMLGIEEEDIIARFGGEEFIVAFINKDKYEATEILNKIRIEVGNVIFENNVTVTFSAGVEEWDGTSIYLVIEKADNLLYKAKHKG
ncbi:MAG: tetratricopeptide repeat-containing diguanylate cyclase, partial [Clostridium sp.]